MSFAAHTAWAGKGGAGDPDFRKKVLKMLKLKAFVRDATCKQFASLLLSRSGLPELGKTAPLRGERGDVDRRLEKREPPIFVDEIKQSEGTRLGVRLQASVSTDAPGGWQLELFRTQALVRSRTLFRFRARPVDNRPSCELQNIGFSASWSEAAPGAIPKQLAQVLSSDTCLDLFDPDQAVPESEPARLQLQGFMKSDCSIGLRYFESVKRSLTGGVE